MNSFIALLLLFVSIHSLADQSPVNCSSADAEVCAGVYETACDQGLRNGCTQRSLQLLNQNRSADAFQFAKRGCEPIEQADARACYTLGYFYEHGVGTAQDARLALKFYLESCLSTRSHRSYAKGCHNYAHLLENGLGTTQDTKAALRMYNNSCAAGIPQSCVNAGKLLFDGKGMAKDIDMAVINFDRACVMRNETACGNLDVIRKAGLATKTFSLLDEERQRIPPELPATQRYILAMEAIRGKHYAAGTQALKRLSDQKMVDATYAYAMLLCNGEGVSKDRAQCGVLLQRAADLNHPHAMYYLAHMHLAGDGVKYNPGWAEALMTRAAELGMEEAVAESIRLRDARRAKEEAAHQGLVAQHQANQQAERERDWQTVNAAWQAYFQRQAERRGQEVCALVLSGQRMTQQCMSKDHFDKYYRP